VDQSAIEKMKGIRVGARKGKRPLQKKKKRKGRQNGSQTKGINGNKTFKNV